MKHIIKSLLVLSFVLMMTAPAFCATVDDYLISGNAKYTKHDVDGAIADYTKAIELKPDYAIAYFNRGTAKKAKGDLDGAITDYTKAIELKPDSEFAFINRGNAKSAKGDLDGAIADFNRAIELKPNYPDAFNSRGIAKYDKHDLDGAIADFNRAIELKPDFEFAFNNRGNAKRAKGDLGGAIADYNKAIQLNPKDSGALHSCGCLLYDSRNFTDALGDFRKVIELESTYDYARLRIWLVRARLGEADAATVELKTYLAGRTNGKRDDWESKIGHFLIGEITEAEVLAAAKNVDPKVQTGQMCEAWFYAGSKRLFAGDKATAMDYFQKSIATDQKTYKEYASAAAELKFLRAGK